jgi:hypothetical protein
MPISQILQLGYLCATITSDRSRASRAGREPADSPAPDSAAASLAPDPEVSLAAVDSPAAKVADSPAAKVADSPAAKVVDSPEVPAEPEDSPALLAAADSPALLALAASPEADFPEALAAVFPEAPAADFPEVPAVSQAVNLAVLLRVTAPAHP